MSILSDLNQSPPSDDGAQTESNRVKWQTLEDKIITPLDSFLQNWHSDQRGGLTTGGSGGAYTVTTNITYTSLTDIPLLVATANHSPSGSNTMQVDGLAVKTLTNASAISIDEPFVFVYNGTADTFDVIAPANLPITTQGDVIRGSSTGGAERLPVGTNGQVLTTDGVDVIWGAGVAAGSVMAWLTSTPPDGWLHCNGQTLDASVNTQYQNLFDVIGNAFGGTDNTDFQLPDFRGQFLRGWDNGAGVDPDAASRTGGDTVGSTQDDAFQSHTHTYKNALSGGSGVLSGGSDPTNTNSQTTGVTGRTSTETRPKNIAVMHIIKY